MEDDKTPTGEVPEAGAAPTALPADDDQQQPAVDTTDQGEPTTTDDGGEQSQETDEQPLPANVDKELANYAKGQGIDDISELTERELKFLKQARDNVVEKRQQMQQANELEAASTVTREDVPNATPEQFENVRLSNIEKRLELNNWVMRNPDKAVLEPQMVEILNEDPRKKLLLADGYLSYDDLHAMAKGRQDNTAQLKSQGARDALKSLAAKQQSAVPRGNATTNAPAPKKRFEDMSIQEMEQKLGFHRQ